VINQSQLHSLDGGAITDKVPSLAYFSITVERAKLGMVTTDSSHVISQYRRKLKLQFTFEFPNREQ